MYLSEASSWAGLVPLEVFSVGLLLILLGLLRCLFYILQINLNIIVIRKKNIVSKETPIQSLCL